MQNLSEPDRAAGFCTCLSTLPDDMRYEGRDLLQEKNMKTVILAAAIVLLLPSCRQVDEITGNRPIVDTRGVDMEAYESDLEDCFGFADQVEADNRILTGAATGAVVGGVIGAAAGNSETAKRGAGVGTASGTLSGTGKVMAERQRVVRNCLAGRGYLVLN